MQFKKGIKSRRDKIVITRHIMMHQLLYLCGCHEEVDMQHLVHHDMPCDPNLFSSAFYTIAFYLLALHFSV